MIFDAIANLFILTVRGILVLLPDIKAFPESVQFAWTFLAQSIAGLLYFLAPEVGSVVLWGAQTIVFCCIILFSWWGFTTIWGLIRG